MNLNLRELVKIYNLHPDFESLLELLKNGQQRKCFLKGAVGSSAAMFAASLISALKRFYLFILNDEEEAAYLQTDLEQLLHGVPVHFFPSTYKRVIKHKKTDKSNIVLRTEALNAMAGYKEGALVVVTYPEAISEKVISPDNLEKNTLTVNKGDQLSIEFVGEVMEEYHFTLVDFVTDPGQYAIRGSIVDVFSFKDEKPYRIDFFGDEVDSVRTFDIDSQLSDNQLNSVTIIPDTSNLAAREQGVNLFDFLRTSPVIWIKDVPIVSHTLDEIISREHNQDENPGSFTIEGDAFKEYLFNYNLVEFGKQAFFPDDITVEITTSHQPSFNKNFELLGKKFTELAENGFTNYLFSENEKQIKRLANIFRDINQNVHFEPVQASLHEGFIDSGLKVALFTDHQIFDRYHKAKVKQGFAKKERITIRDLTSLKPGDYVVHIDHGIGKFGGLETIDVNGKKQEALRLIYRDNDILFVNIHALHKISKYKGREGEAPKIYKLGTGAWNKLKINTKKKVKDIARELIRLYAKRKEIKGFGFAPDTYMQEELEASFIYEDTPDQMSATQGVKQGMEASFPMDHLVCGDVGFGKTEIAIRAAFKAAADNKQVAVLVPTTILALQHYTTFSERLKDFPVAIEYISRLKKPAEQKAILRKLEAGKIDIIIGTHRIVSKDVKFKDLGLLIIDEEQKFGVAIKEKLKQLKVNLDTLTLTATPIPRTLQFSLMGARDLSIINTPPPNRHPIITEVHTFNEEIIADAINYEVARGGQVFFIHNRVQNIHEVEALVNNICPRVKTITAHGQMEGKQLETIMLNFINGDHDVLIATTIIESGLDIPNANTIIVNNAHHFGLSDLHQLRGRVGRSNKKAYCYLMAPASTTLTQEAKRRLTAIEEFSELGSGFNIAMQDLDIRGAGNLLGAEQSGFISEIGYETYHRILNEAMEELREEEFSELLAGEKEEEIKKKGIPGTRRKKYVSDCQVDTDFEILFPESYISNIAERIQMYRELDNLKDEEQLDNFKTRLEDRFGKIPRESLELMNIVRMRWKAMELGMEKISIRNRKMVIYFIANQLSPFYQSDVFSGILLFVQKNAALARMKESKNKLTLSFENVKNTAKALELVSYIHDIALCKAEVE